MTNNTDTDTTFAPREYYCTTCMKGHLLSTQTCNRLPRGEFTATCLRCCGHNHG